MSLPRFLVGMVSVLLVFAFSSYAMTGSLGSTLVQTLICAVLLQLGYFLVILALVARGEPETTSQSKDAHRKEETESDGIAAKIRHMLRSHHS